MTHLERMLLFGVVKDLLSDELRSFRSSLDLTNDQIMRRADRVAGVMVDEIERLEPFGITERLARHG